ncbi:MAG: hypothetical protein V3V65_04520, partial [Hyphomicrobium sp.]
MSKTCFQHDAYPIPPIPHVISPLIPCHPGSDAPGQGCNPGNGGGQTLALRGAVKAASATNKEK